jgi:hypothetical protein
MNEKVLIEQTNGLTDLLIKEGWLVIVVVGIEAE